MSQPILTLPIPPYLRSKLLRNGYLYVSDFDCTSGLDLRHFLTSSEISLLSTLSHSHPSTVSASTARRALVNLKSIPTLSQITDELLGGRGVPLESTLLAVGVPGSGRTRFCLRLCISVQLPVSDGGLNAKAVYIDTNGSFTAAGFSRAARECAAGGRCEGVRVFRVFGCVQLIALLDSFDEICRELIDVKLLVVNSITWPFLVSEKDILKRRALQQYIAQRISIISAKHKIAVVLVGQSKSDKPSHPDYSAMIDGDVWNAIATNYIHFKPYGDSNALCLLRSSMYPINNQVVLPIPTIHQ